MKALPIHILNATNTGSRSAVQRLNQSLYVRKGEPNRRKPGLEPRPARKGEPGVTERDLIASWTDASLLLVILHYLLKNNTQFIGGNGAGQDAPPGGYLLTTNRGWRRE